MGFGREKTVYAYFAVASCSLFPHNSIMRLLIAKAAIIVTVADDFYDMEASLPDLEILTLAVQRYTARLPRYMHLVSFGMHFDVQ